MAINIRETIKGAFSALIYTVPGIMCPEVLKGFAEKILPKGDAVYYPDKKLFIYTLNSLLKTELQEKSITARYPKFLKGRGRGFIIKDEKVEKEVTVAFSKGKRIEIIDIKSLSNKTQ